MNTPDFWVTNLEYIAELAASARRAEVSVLTESAGGRPVYQFAYGDRDDRAGSANYSSACGAHDRACYSQRAGKKPVVLLLGAEHGAEVEGTAALVNLIHVLEEGEDLRGAGFEHIRELVDRVRLVIVPVCNPDGRARFTHEAALGMTMDEQRYWFQGTWKSGGLCGWPGCKKVHPIKDASDFMGAYFNDDGVNMVHDNFFAPMAPETRGILALADAERADYVCHLHGGSNSANALLMTNYVTREVLEEIRELQVRCDREARRRLGLVFTVSDIPGREEGDTPQSFNIMSAVHHVCGAVSVTFESNQCVVGYPGANYTHEQVYLSHMLLFEQLLEQALEKAEKGW